MFLCGIFLSLFFFLRWVAVNPSHQFTVRPNLYSIQNVLCVADNNLPDGPTWTQEPHTDAGWYGEWKEQVGGGPQRAAQDTQAQQPP